MKFIVATALATTAFAATLAMTAANAQSLGEKSGVNSALGVAPTTQDFVTEAAASDMFEIQSSQLAQQKGDAAAKAFATKMIADHTKTTAALKAMVGDGKVKASLPTAMSSSENSMLDKLKSLSGNDFNKQYKSDQVSAHKSAVSLFERYAKSGENAELKAWAGKTLPDLQDHLKMARDNDK